MVYMGSTVVYGRGSAIVTDAGMDTQMGKSQISCQSAGRADFYSVSLHS